MKLELKHLASYLEHKVVLSYIDCLTKRKRNAFLSGISNEGIETTYLRKIKGCSGDYISWNGNNNVNDLLVKPILFPLSSLTKEMYYKLSGKNENDDFAFFYGKNNGDFDKRDYIYRQGYSGKTYMLEYGYYQFPYEIIYFFFKNKFDVFGLIELGLAEPVTEDFNPYK